MHVLPQREPSDPLPLCVCVRAYAHPRAPVPQPQVLSEGRTATVKRGGKHPKFPDVGSTVPLRYTARGGSALYLHVQAWDADIGLRDDLIGQVRRCCWCWCCW
jgi:hypothetical protein